MATATQVQVIQGGNTEYRVIRTPEELQALSRKKMSSQRQTHKAAVKQEGKPEAETSE